KMASASMAATPGDEAASGPHAAPGDGAAVPAPPAATPGPEAVPAPPAATPVSEAPAAPPVVTTPDPDAAVERAIHRMSRRALLGGALAVGAGWAGLRWLDTRPTEDELVWPLRRVLQFNERLFHGMFRSTALAPEFPLSAAREPINNYHDETPEI